MKSIRSVAVIVGAMGALVVACAVVLQSRELSVPPVGSCEVSPAAGRVVASAQTPPDAIARCLDGVSSSQSTALAYGWIAALAVLALGIAVSVAAGGTRRRAAARQVGSASLPVRPRAAAAAQVRSANGHAAGACARERAILATACIEVGDLVDSAALREQLLDALKASGVSPVEAGVGEPFDSSRHKAVGTIPTSDRGNDNTVAETQRPGYVDRGKRVRYPEVLVFKWSGARE